MESSPATSQTSAGSLRLARCSECAYDLTGLGDVGACPECGRAYDQGTVVLWGAASGSHARLDNAGPEALWWIIPLFALQLVWPLLHGLHIPRGPYVSVMLGVWGALTCCGFGYLLFKRFSVRHPGLVQVRLSRDGCLQIDDLSGAYRTEMTVVFVVGVLLVLFVFVHAARGWYTTGDTLRFVLTAVAAAVGLVGLAWWRWNGRAGRLPDGSDLAVTPPMPWAEVADVQLEPASNPRRYRLRLRRSGWWHITVDVVDAELEMTPAQANELAARIGAWRAAAATAG